MIYPVTAVFVWCGINAKKHVPQYCQWFFRLPDAFFCGKNRRHSVTLISGSLETNGSILQIVTLTATSVQSVSLFPRPTRKDLFFRSYLST